ncbi:AAA family ATPase [Vibrio ostreicida]|uniref:Cellulose synthase operon protein YhjQ/BcsQ n=1 Tax=Vibrio ostreicida TaxID=526588 RepID=A0ABT8BYN7_9VIBR|nr:cellulose synthase operon protein YhjQ/BcsQ [Vibrio ostreicida]MDN3612281.1 cellulose synthase operon protein YhjQ/BcsQ [Vibrio ostreicida]NPD08664.1 P-loop NTPase [Vibrio ostreicida]
MKTQSVSALVAFSPAMDHYSLSLAFAEQGITRLVEVSLDREQIIKQALMEDYGVIVLDVIALALEDAVDWVRDIVQRTGGRVVVIGNNDQIAFYREMLASGAVDYVVNPAAPDCFSSLNFAPPSPASHSGRVISVVGAKGGAGTSTLVASLARALNQRQQSVTMVDLDFSAGDLDLQFNVQGNEALVEMLQYPERLEPVVFERCGINIQSGLTLFTGYLPLDSAPFWPDKQALSHFSRDCLHNTDNLIFDIPAYSLRDQVGRSVLKSADVRIVVVEPTLASIRNAGQIIKGLAGGSEMNENKKTLIVVNHTKSNHASLIGLKEIHRTLGIDVDASVPFAPKHFLSCNSLGQSPLKGHRPFLNALNQLVHKVLDEPAMPSYRFWNRSA